MKFILVNSFLLQGDKKICYSRFMSYADRIRTLRSSRNWTQADLARQIGGGITNQSVSGWERGIAKPSRENIFELSRIFGVPVEGFQTEGGKAERSAPVQEPAPPGSASLVHVAIEETLLAAGISESLHLLNLFPRVPSVRLH